MPKANLNIPTPVDKPEDAEIELREKEEYLIEKGGKVIPIRPAAEARAARDQADIEEIRKTVSGTATETRTAPAPEKELHAIAQETLELRKELSIIAAALDAPEPEQPGFLKRMFAGKQEKARWAGQKRFEERRATGDLETTAREMSERLRTLEDRWKTVVAALPEEARKEYDEQWRAITALQEEMKEVYDEQKALPPVGRSAGEGGPMEKRDMPEVFRVGEKEFPVMKLEIGGKTPKEYEAELEKAGFRIGTWGKEILKRIKPDEERREENVVRLTVADLGFTKAARYDEICRRAKEFGLELAPAEVGPELRLILKDQPMNDSFLIAMKPIKDRLRDPSIFYVARNDDGSWLFASHGRPGDEWSPDRSFAFVPRKQSSNT